MWTVAVVLALCCPAPTDTAPTWFREHVQFLTHDGGRWIADNAAYRGPNEPHAAYGITWTLGFSGALAHGTLFGVRADGTEDRFWEFVLYWDPLQDHAVVVQVQNGGPFGSDILRPTAPDRGELDQTFWFPGSTSRQLPRERRVGETQDSESFVCRDGDWQADRHYVWRLEASR